MDRFNQRLNNILNDDEECIICPYCQSRILKEEIDKQLKEQEHIIIKLVMCYICERLWIP